MGMKKGSLAGTLRLLICAADDRGHCDGWRGILVCGLPAGHGGRWHRDIAWPIRWPVKEGESK